MSKKSYKTVDALTPNDFEQFPVWEYLNDDAAGELSVRPIKALPIEDLNNKVVGIQIKLHCGDLNWASIGNVNVKHPDQNEHFLSLSLERNGKWFHLARYHDFDYEQRGPSALAKFLKKSIEDVFPISYDLRSLVRGKPAFLSGRINLEPRKKLTRAEIIALAVKG